MIYKEISQAFIFFIVKRFRISTLKNFLFNLEKEKKFFKMENFIKNNGFFSAQFFLNPLKSISLIKRFIFFILKNSEKLFKKSAFSISKFFPSFKFSYKEIKSFFPISNFIETKNLNQLVWIQGIIQEISPPLIKKLRKKINFNKRNNELKNTNEQSTKGKTYNFFSSRNSCKEKFPLINYQEAKIFLHEIKNKNKKITKFSEFYVIFSNNMVDKLIPGENISVLGILKRNSENFLGNSKIPFETSFLVEAIYAKIKKKKVSWKRILNKKKVSIIDFQNIWQDSKIKGTGLVERKHLLKYFLKNSKFSYYSKLGIILSLIGGLQQNSKKGKGKKNFCNFLLLGGKETDHSLFLKKIQNFWIDYIFLNYEISPTKITNLYLNRDKKKWNQLSCSSLFSSSGIIIIGNYQINKNNSLNSILKFFNNSTLNFFNSKIRSKIKIKSPLFLSINLNQIHPNFKKNKINLSYQKISSPKKINQIWIELFSIFDIYFIFKKENIFEIRNEKKKLLPWTKIDSLGEKGRFLNRKIKSYKKWKKKIIRSYFFFSKAYRCLSFSRKAEKFLIFFYSYEISIDYTSEKPILALEKIIKLSEANARILSRDEIQIQDCILAIFIINKSFFFYQKKRKFFKKNELEKKKIEILFLNKIFQYLLKKFLFISYDDYFTLCGGNFKRS